MGEERGEEGVTRVEAKMLCAPNVPEQKIKTVERCADQSRPEQFNPENLLSNSNLFGRRSKYFCCSFAGSLRF